MQILQIINSVFTSNTYLLNSDTESSCWLIDIGDIKPVLELIPSDKNIKGVFLTHTHYDHIYGINKLIECYPECIVYTARAGKEALFCDKMNISRYHEDPIIFSGSNVCLLREGDSIELFQGEWLNIAETPGHDLSCLTYYTEKEIFTGDSYIPGIKVIASFPRSNKTDAETSKNRILRLASNRNLYPGHGEIHKLEL